MVFEWLQLHAKLLHIVLPEARAVCELWHRHGVLNLGGHRRRLLAAEVFLQALSNLEGDIQCSHIENYSAARFTLIFIFSKF